MSDARQRLDRRSRYRRQGSIVSWIGLLLGLILGAAFGLFLAWGPFQTIETDVTPRELGPQAQADYVVAISLAYAYDSDLTTAINRLTTLNLGPDPLQAVADLACELTRSGYVNSTAGLRAVRTMRTFYQLQGKTGCADQLIPAVEPSLAVALIPPSPTASLPPPPSKTPIAEQTAPAPLPTRTPTATNPAEREYIGSIVNTYCDTQNPGLIEVIVRRVGATEGDPAQPVRVRWADGEDTFFTGMKPEQGLGYADFVMEPGETYIISMPGLSDPIANELEADPCRTTGGGTSVTSYRVSFLRNN